MSIYRGKLAPANSWTKLLHNGPACVCIVCVCVQLSYLQSCVQLRARGRRQERDLYSVVIERTMPGLRKPLESLKYRGRRENRNITPWWRGGRDGIVVALYRAIFGFVAPG